MLAFVSGACPAIMVGYLGLEAAWSGLGVGWRFGYVCAVSLTSVMFTIGLATCRRGVLTGAKWACI